MKFYSGPLSMFGAKAEIALREKGIPFELEMVPFEMKTLYEPKHPEVVRINPKRQVPVLIDGDLELFDSTQIFEYLETLKRDPALWPAEPRARARARFYEEMERTIGGQEWIAGAYSYVDIAFYMAQLFGERMGAPIPAGLTRLHVWRDRMSARPAVRQVAGAMGRYLLAIGRTLPSFMGKLGLNT